MRTNSAINNPITTIAMIQESRFKSLRIFSISFQNLVHDKITENGFKAHFLTSQRRPTGFPKQGNISQNEGLFFPRQKQNTTNSY